MVYDVERRLPTGVDASDWSLITAHPSSYLAGDHRVVQPFAAAFGSNDSGDSFNDSLFRKDEGYSLASPSGTPSRCSRACLAYIQVGAFESAILSKLY